MGGLRSTVLTSTRYRLMPLCHAAVDLAFITDDDAKMLKNATYFCL